MQEFENFRRCREAGEFYKPRARVFPTSKVAEPAELPAYVERLGKNQFRLMVERNRKGQPLCDPRELQKAGQYLAHGSCSINVNDVYPASAKWPHAQAAWLPEEIHSGPREVRDLFVDGSDHVAHAPPYCTWDILFGKPDYCVEGHTLTLKSKTDTSEVEEPNGT
jgi:hypothetical protein